MASSMNWQPKHVGDHNVSRWAPCNITSRDTKARMKCTEEKMGPQRQGLAASSSADGQLHTPFSESVMTNFQGTMDPHAKITELNEDGDIIMSDLDNIAIASKRAHILKSERGSGISATSITLSEHLTPPQRISNSPYIIVVDTGFLLAHLQVVNNLIDAHPVWQHVVLLPWVTIMELHGLRTLRPRKDIDIDTLARRATHWISEKLTLRPPGLEVQQEEEPSAVDFNKSVNTILGSCQYIRDGLRMPVVLLSDDQSLCMQAIAYGIRTFSLNSGSKLSADKILRSLLERNNTGLVGYSPSLQSGAISRSQGLYASVHAPSSKVLYDGQLDVRECQDIRFYPMTNKHYTLGSYQYLNLTDSQSPGGNPIPLELYTSIHAPTFGSHKDQSPSLTRLAHSPRPLYGVGHPPPNAPFSHRSTGNEVQHFNEIDVGRILRPVLKQFLLTFQTALLHNFPELIERHMTQKLGSYPNRTAFGSPKDAIHHLSDIESFLYRHWSTVFSYAFPNGDNISLVLKDRGYSRTWQEWWNWSAGLESALIPRKLAIEDWVAAWAYIWRHLLPPGDDYTVYNQTQETWSDMLCPIFEVLGGHY